MTTIHPLACVHPGAKLGENVEIGPFAFVDDNVVIGDGSKILNGASVYNHVRIGKDCTVFPGAVVGAIPQDLKFEGEESWVEIGDRVNIRECATVNRGTKASGKGITRIGSDTLIMSYAHIAHDCCIGNHCIIVSYAGLAGETDVDDWGIIGGKSGSHQFSHIGTHAFVGAVSKILKDVPPYVLAGRDPLRFEGVNRTGLLRRGFSEEQVNLIKDMYDVIYFKGMNFSQALDYIEQNYPESDIRNTIVGFIRNSKRGIIPKPRPGKD
ncbi:MAG: acyl-ACP--UDP-N-acetylglucosamine O-acyltransferase [Bacteroidales bacterium]|nr:acyl-ACP--UDP-N-acetylglucosamine O-acyltransferase [Bacteroidales bacterium]